MPHVCEHVSSTLDINVVNKCNVIHGIVMHERTFCANSGTHFNFNANIIYNYVYVFVFLA